jgi:SAM-dependent methyltransferase
MAGGSAASYATVTELPGAYGTPEELSMLYTRYRWAKTLSAGRDVLEVACGPGIGLSYLACGARTVVGVDIDPVLLRRARSRRGVNVPLACVDAHALPFADGTFDVVLLFEAIYYLKCPASFLREARRVLRPAGTLLVCLPNRQWAGFNPSPFAHGYPSVAEIYDALSAAGFAPRVYGGFAARVDTIGDRLLLGVRRAAVRLHLVPRTMKGKEFLKRLLFRRSASLPAEIEDGMAPAGELHQLKPEGTAATYKVLYAEGRVPTPEDAVRAPAAR